MRFKDENIRLKLNGYNFKAFLEDSDINYETKDQQLPFAPISFTNTSVATRVNQTAKFTFNVFSETRYECITNFKNLMALVRSIKPIYNIIDDQYVPSSANITGFVTLGFSGMPYNDRESINLHLTSFNYSINKEIGYIEIPKSEIDSPSESKWFDTGGMKLIPLAYKLSLEGRILLQFDDTVRRFGNRIQRTSKPIQRVLQTAIDSTDDNEIEEVRKIYLGLTNQDILNLNSSDMAEAAARVRAMQQQELVKPDGTFDDSRYNTAQQPQTPEITPQLTQQNKEYDEGVYNKQADEIKSLGKRDYNE